MGRPFATAVAAIPDTALRVVLDGAPCALLPRGGGTLGELLAPAGLPGTDGLPPPRSGIHGIRHLRMVALLSVKLALAEGWDASRAEEGGDLWCLWVAGCLHDLGRRDDGTDPEHAERGAVIAERYLGRRNPAEGAASTVVRLIRNHGKGDESGLAPLDRIFKDADGLDRHRLSPWDLDVSRLRTDTARARSRELWGLCWSERRLGF